MTVWLGTAVFACAMVLGVAAKADPIPMRLPDSVANARAADMRATRRHRHVRVEEDRRFAHVAPSYYARPYFYRPIPGPQLPFFAYGPFVW